MSIGIYEIVNKINNKKIIGSSSRLEIRYKQHWSDLRGDRHKNYYLQRSWNKYGESNFYFRIIEKCQKKDLIDKEGFWIEKLQTYKRNNGYNLCRYPRASRLGCKARPETILKMKQSLSGKNHPNWGRKIPRISVEKTATTQRGVPKPNSGRKKKYILFDPYGKRIIIKGIRKFCRDNNFSLCMFFQLVSGKRKEYKGWKMGCKLLK